MMPTPSNYYTSLYCKFPLYTLGQWNWAQNEGERNKIVTKLHSLVMCNKLQTLTHICGMCMNHIVLQNKIQRFRSVFGFCCFISIVCWFEFELFLFSFDCRRSRHKMNSTNVNICTIWCRLYFICDFILFFCFFFFFYSFLHLYFVVLKTLNVIA